MAVFNLQLASAVTNLMNQSPGLRVYVADFNQLLSNLVSAPVSYGFTVSTIGALQDTALTDKSFTGPGAEYVFWDPVHPTARGYALIAALAFQSVGVQLKVARSGANLNLTIGNVYPGLPYTIQSSSNLSSWSTDQTFTASDTNTSMVVTNVPGSTRFYRVS